MISSVLAVLLLVLVLSLVVAVCRALHPTLSDITGLIISVVVGISSLWLSRYYLPDSFFETDFAEYCVSVLTMDSTESMPPKRSKLAAFLPWWIYRVYADSIIDAFAVGSILSTVLSFVGMYLWGRAVRDAWTGVLAVVVASFMVPLVTMSRFLTFYPEIVMTTVFGAASMVLCVRYARWYTFLLLGLMVGACLLIDVRGVVWAFAYWAGGILVLLFSLYQAYHTETKSRFVMRAVGDFFALHVPIWLSWFAGWWAYASNSASLEKQLDVRPLYVGFDEGNVLLKPPWNIDSHFVWGWFSPWEFPNTIEFIWEQKQLPVPQGFLDWQSNAGAQSLYFYWWWYALWGAMLLSVWFYRTNWRWVGLWISVVPFVVAFHSLATMVEQHIRFYMHALPAVAVVIGVVVGALFDGMALEKRAWVEKSKARFFGALWVRESVVVVVVLLGFWWHSTAMFPLSYTAQWRNSWVFLHQDWSSVQRYIQTGRDQQVNSSNKLSAYMKVCADKMATEPRQKPSLYGN